MDLYTLVSSKGLGKVQHIGNAQNCLHAPSVIVTDGLLYINEEYKAKIRRCKRENYLCQRYKMYIHLRIYSSRLLEYMNFIFAFILFKGFS